MNGHINLRVRVIALWLQLYLSLWGFAFAPDTEFVPVTAKQLIHRVVKTQIWKSIQTHFFLLCDVIGLYYILIVPPLFLCCVVQSLETSHQIQHFSFVMKFDCLCHQIMGYDSLNASTLYVMEMSPDYRTYRKYVLITYPNSSHSAS